jgi:hypothetical protein
MRQWVVAAALALGACGSETDTLHGTLRIEIIPGTFRICGTQPADVKVLDESRKLIAQGASGKPTGGDTNCHADFDLPVPKADSYRIVVTLNGEKPLRVTKSRADLEAANWTVELETRLTPLSGP